MMKKFSIIFLVMVMMAVSVNSVLADSEKCAIGDGRTMDVWVPLVDLIKGGMDPYDDTRPIYTATPKNNWLQFGPNISQSTIEKIKEQYRMTEIKQANGEIFFRAKNVRGIPFHPIQSLPNRGNSLKMEDRFYLEIHNVYKGNEKCVVQSPSIMYFVPEAD